MYLDDSYLPHFCFCSLFSIWGYYQPHTQVTFFLLFFIPFPPAWRGWEHHWNTRFNGEVGPNLVLWASLRFHWVECTHACTCTCIHTHANTHTHTHTCKHTHTHANTHTHKASLQDWVLPLVCRLPSLTVRAASCSPAETKHRTLRQQDYELPACLS